MKIKRKDRGPLDSIADSLIRIANSLDHTCSAGHREHLNVGPRGGHFVTTRCCSICGIHMPSEAYPTDYREYNHRFDDDGLRKENP